MLFRVSDLSPEQMRDERYDLIVVASGYERRATYVVKWLKHRASRKTIVLGFNEATEHPERVSNDSYYRRLPASQSVSLSANDDGPLYDALRRLGDDSRLPLRVLVDYSSMSRLWYAGLLSWARYVSPSRRMTIDFTYAVGNHAEESPPMVISSVSAIPGCEGSPVPINHSVAIFGLGFDGLATMAALEMLQPDVTYAFLASPGARPDYAERARACNAELIRDHCARVFEFPLGSVATVYANLAELVTGHSVSNDVTLIPMGPKPHVLACLLAAIRFPQAACLRVSGERRIIQPIDTDGELVVTQVEFLPDGLSDEPG